jgi:hypothetical protein
MNDFTQKVFLMRQAQRDFFEACRRKQWTKREELLKLCKQLEKDVDEELNKIRK